MNTLLDDFLTRHGLAAECAARRWTPLTGGVSSDIWRVDIEGGRTLCVKRALAQLKVAAEWKAPVSRNAFEWAWICFAFDLVPDAVPEPLVHDEAAGLFAMGFLEPEAHPVWKQQLLDGHVDPAVAGEVGHVLGVLHQASARRDDLAAAFDTGASFHALRLDPYLVATAQRHTDLAGPLERLVERTGAARIALVHGDVSPKNILVGPKGPVLLDAECAWYGDPAFDLAFVLNHLLLKGLHRPADVPALRASADALSKAYFAQVQWEPRHSLEARAAALLPALLLARIDGKSPVEYLQTDAQKDSARAIARPLILDAPGTLTQVLAAWGDALHSRQHPHSPEQEMP